MSPPIVLSVLIAVLYGSICHLFFGRRLWQLPVYLLSALIGFFAGFALGAAFNVEWLRVGAVPLFASSMGAFVALFICWYFSTPPVQRPPSP